MTRQRRSSAESTASTSSASSSSSSSQARSDRRFKNRDDAPPIVSEKRLTFFLPEETYRALRFQTGYFQVANAQEQGEVEDLPETPSALVREAISFWLDQFRPGDERNRSDREWTQRIAALRAAIEQFSGGAAASSASTAAQAPPKLSKRRA